MLQFAPPHEARAIFSYHALQPIIGGIIVECLDIHTRTLIKTVFQFHIVEESVIAIT